MYHTCGYNLVVECHASDLIARVRFPPSAPKCVFVELLESIKTSEFKENKKVNIISQYISRFSRLIFCFLEIKEINHIQKALNI